MIKLLSLKPTTIVRFALVVFLFSSVHNSLFARDRYRSTTSVVKRSVNQVQSDYQPGDYSFHPVTWTEKVQVASDGDRITKGYGGSNWNAGAVSSYRIGAGEDGKFVMTDQGESLSRFIGLSRENVDAGIQHIDYGYMHNGRSCYVYEKGVEKVYLGALVAGDQIAIERIGSTIYYLINEDVVYVSNEPSEGELMVDTSIRLQGHYIDNVQISDNSGGPIEPSSSITVTDVTETGGAISWVNGNGAGRIVIVGVYGDAYPVDGVDYEGNSIFGHGSLLGDVQCVVYDGTGNSVRVEGLMPGREYRVKVIEYDEGGIIGKNYNILDFGAGSFSTVTREAMPLHPVMWTEKVQVTSDGDRITKGYGGSNWNAGAVSSYRIGAGEDGKFVMTDQGESLSRFIGLSRENVDAGIQHIDYGYMHNGRSCYVYEKGVEKVYLGALVAGDQIAIERIGSTIYYLINEGVVYVSNEPSTSELMVDASIRLIGHYIDNVLISGQLKSHFYAISSGNWSDPSVWSPSPNGSPGNLIPDSSSEVFIDGHVITVESDSESSSIIISNESPGSELKVIDGILNVYGEVTIINENTNNLDCKMTISNSGALNIVESQ